MGGFSSWGRLTQCQGLFIISIKLGFIINSWLLFLYVDEKEKNIYCISDMQVSERTECATCAVLCPVRWHSAQVQRMGLWWLLEVSVRRACRLVACNPPSAPSHSRSHSSHLLRSAGQHLRAPAIRWRQAHTPPPKLGISYSSIFVHCRDPPKKLFPWKKLCS